MEPVGAQWRIRSRARQSVFFCANGFGRIGLPDTNDDGLLQVTGSDDLMTTKVKVVLQRAGAQDYCDVAAMIQAGVSLARGLAAAGMFGPNFQPSESLKALVFFGMAVCKH